MSESLHRNEPGHLPLPVLRGCQVICALLLLGALWLFLWGGTQEGRVTIVLAALTGVLGTTWGLLALPLMAPIFLLDASKTHMLVVLDALVVGILLGRVLRWGRNGDRSLAGGWGMWPYWLVGVSLLVLGAGWVGILNLIHMEYPLGTPERPLHHTLMLAAYGPATEPPWSLRVLWNWVTAILLAVVAARTVTPLLAARWMKLAGLSLLVISILGFLSAFGFFSFSHLRAENPDPLHFGRLQGPAGHSGWFAQWFVFAWVGLALFWAPGARKRQLAVLAALLVVGIVLLMTGARASLLGVILAAVLVAGLPWGASRWNPRVVLLLPVGFVALFVVGLFMEGSIGDRLMNLLRFQDRANYYVSSWHLIHDAPMGVGMGMHSRAYESRFLEFWPWYQSDHVTAHSTWLHTLVEGGPFLPMLLLMGIGGLVVGSRRALVSMEAGEKRIVSAIVAGLAGLLVVSFMQYVFYIRVIELVVWVGGGFLVGLIRQHQLARSPERELVVTWGGRRLLLAAGAASVLVVSMTAFTFDPGMAWRQPDGNRETGFSFWTGSSWKTAIPPETRQITFSLHRKATPCTVAIHWAGGGSKTVFMEPDEWRYFELNIEEPRGSRPLDPIRWFSVEVTPVWRPSEVFEGTMDDRALGVYFHELNMETGIY